MPSSVTYSKQCQWEVSTILCKLLKYDLKSMFKTFVPLWVAVLLASLANRFIAELQGSGGMSDASPLFISAMVYFGLLMGVMVLCVLLIIQRFYNGLLRDEGYLMFTLPVKPWQLIASKGIASTLIVCLSGVFAVLSVFVMAFNATFTQFMDEFLMLLGNFTGELWLFLLSLCIFILVSIIASVMQVYTAMSLGHLANKNRIVWSVVGFVGIQTFFSIVKWIGLYAMDATVSDEMLIEMINGTMFTGGVALLILSLLTMVQIALLFAVSERILSKRLNLE